ncbi:MAG: hypothetical protein F6J94_24430 [Moorea sp. SIO1F2]|uniref:hypothetical protein n=1 Tax=Moorena sp. SIO1F2 TaxID=2607819 RepID=UPI0013BBEFFE|nr:hypothetical protein [Moorena sp. SIO1F2]NET84946.1 hypothetical protein [Moorena sp. SIO1F2]
MAKRPRYANGHAKGLTLAKRPRYANGHAKGLTLAKRPRYANGHATRCSVRAATRSHNQYGDERLVGETLAQYLIWEPLRRPVLL